MHAPSRHPAEGARTNRAEWGRIGRAEKTLDLVSGSCYFEFVVRPRAAIINLLPIGPTVCAARLILIKVLVKVLIKVLIQARNQV